MDKFKKMFSDIKLRKMFPPERTNQFFEALFGDPSEGAYDIELRFKDAMDSRLEFEFLLRARPGKCLACSYTFGLPRVFSKHPVIDIQGLIRKIAEMIKNEAEIKSWHLGATRILSPEMHSIPLVISIKKKKHEK